MMLTLNVDPALIEGGFHLSIVAEGASLHDDTLAWNKTDKPVKFMSIFPSMFNKKDYFRNHAKEFRVGTQTCHGLHSM